MFAFAATQLTATAALRVAPRARHARHCRRATSVVRATSTTDPAEESSNTDTTLSQGEREELEGEADWDETASAATRRGVIVRDAGADIIDRGDGSFLEAAPFGDDNSMLTNAIWVAFKAGLGRNK